MSFTKPRKILQQGTRVAQPAASLVAEGTLYFVTDEGVIERSNLVTWDAWTTGTSGSLLIASDDDVVDLWRYVLSRLNLIDAILGIDRDDAVIPVPDLVLQLEGVLEP